MRSQGSRLTDPRPRCGHPMEERSSGRPATAAAIKEPPMARDKMSCSSRVPNQMVISSHRPTTAISSLSLVSLALAFQLGLWPSTAIENHFPISKPAPSSLNQFSPDSRWMAYTSDETGQPEIFVESVPAGKGRWQVSTEAVAGPPGVATGPNCSIAGTQIMAVPIRLTSTSVESGKPLSLFDVSYETRFQVSSDGQRFLIAVPVDGLARGGNLPSTQTGAPGSRSNQSFATQRIICFNR